MVNDDVTLDRENRDRASVGAVYTQTNDATENAVSLFSRASNGALSFVASYPTGGRGNGAPGLGSQGSVVIAEARFLLAVNAGSNEISSFRIGDRSLTLVETIPSSGSMPVSIASWGPFVYVLNAGSDNITGFRINHLGDLTPIAGSTRSLSGSGVGGAQVSFNPNGRLVVVSEKATNKISVFTVEAQGLLSNAFVHNSSGMTPFGFEFTANGRLVVSEAFGGAPNGSATSSYALSLDGALVPVSPSVPTTETAACWVVITSNQAYAYVTNTGSNSVTGYRVAANGTLRRLDDNGVTASTLTNPIDAALSRGSQFLYTLDRGSAAISIFRVNSNGSLTPAGSEGGLPATAFGLAAR
jgi:6-phosphogluconolactonase (cycloisomerase 2 family)